MAGYNYFPGVQNGGKGSGGAGSNTYNYYNPGSTYGGSWQPGEFATSPIGNQYLEDNQQAAFTRYLADRGFRDYTGRGEFARGQFGKVKGGYEAALATNSEMSFQDYLGGLGNTVDNEYRRLTPEQRGENASLFQTRARYIPR